MNKHEELVSKIAEEMAKLDIYEYVYEHKDDRETCRAAFNNAIDNNIEKARIAVKLMAQAYEDGYMSNCDPYDKIDIYESWLSICRWEMEGMGLIPPTGEEDGEDAK